jgi:hypothetical protein
MAAGAGADRDQAVDAGLGRLACVPQADDVVEHDAAVAVHRLDQVRHGAERSHDERHAVPHTGLEILLQARIRTVHDQVHAPGRMSLIQRTADLVEPLDELRGAATIQRREGGRRAAPAGLDDQLRAGHQEHRRRHDRHRQPTAKGLRQSHGAGPDPSSGQ